MNKQKCGFVAIIGVPNSGKSTLINQLVGTKISIVTRKVQTTRSKIIGIVIEGESQIVLLDTPGIFNPKRRLDRAMVKTAWSAVSDSDLIAVIIDVNQKRTADSKAILKQLNDSGVEPILLLNKIDLIQPDELLQFTSEITAEIKTDRVFMISAINGNGIDDFRKYVAEKLPEGPWLYPADQITDIPERLLAAEITREKIFHYLHQELPYAIAVETDSWEEFDNGAVKISQTIYVQKANQRSIVLGKSGQMIKLIGEKSREELQYLMDRKVHLFLHVKVRENWTDKPHYYNLLGLDFDV